METIPDEPLSTVPVPNPALDDKLDDLIPHWINAVKTVVEQKEKYWYLSQGEGKALLLLSVAPEGLCSGELCAEMHLTTGRMANILNQLIQKGFIEREVVPTNRRKSKITLTQAGACHVECIMHEARCRASTTLRRLGREDAETLIRLLSKLAETVEDSTTSFIPDTTKTESPRINTTTSDPSIPNRPSRPTP